MRAEWSRLRDDRGEVYWRIEPNGDLHLIVKSWANVPSTHDASSHERVGPDR